MSSGLIIIVDDDPTFRKLYTDFLTVHGYTVMAAKSGGEAMKILLNCTPKVLLLDISMPRLDGIETCKQMRRIHGNDMPILFLTSYNDIDKLRDCLQAGGDDFMIKSDNLDSILERIRFWSTAPNRQEARLRHREVVREVENTIERIELETKAPKGVDYQAAKGVDYKVDKMSRLMSTAQSLADQANLTGRDNKLYVFGYAAGIVSHWADTQLGVKSRYLDYLRAALAGSYLLKREEIFEVIGNFDRVSAEPLFITARKRARADCQNSNEAQGGVMMIYGAGMKSAAEG